MRTSFGYCPGTESVLADVKTGEYRFLGAWKESFLLLVLSAGRFLSLSIGLVASTSPIAWRFMFRAATRGERRDGATLVTGGAADRSVGTVGARRGGATPGPFGLVSTFLGVVSEGAGGDGWSGIATLRGGLIRDILGGGAALRRG